MRFCWWIGHSGTSAVIAAQLGTAMMPWCSLMRRALISGMTSGTSAAMRNADELSTTTAPALTAIGRELAGDAAARREQGDVDAFERPLGQFLDDDLLAAKADGLSGGAGARQRLQPANREFALVHGGDEFSADGAGDADNGHGGIAVHVGLLGMAIKKPRTLRCGASDQAIWLSTRRARYPPPEGAFFSS